MVSTGVMLELALRMILPKLASILGLNPVSVMRLRISVISPRRSAAFSALICPAIWVNSASVYSVNDLIALAVAAVESWLRGAVDGVLAPENHANNRATATPTKRRKKIDLTILPTVLDLSNTPHNSARFPRMSWQSERTAVLLALYRRTFH